MDGWICAIDRRALFREVTEAIGIVGHVKLLDLIPLVLMALYGTPNDESANQNTLRLGLIPPNL